MSNENANKSEDFTLKRSFSFPEEIKSRTAAAQ